MHQKIESQINALIKRDTTQTRNTPATPERALEVALAYIDATFEDNPNLAAEHHNGDFTLATNISAPLLKRIDATRNLLESLQRKQYAARVKIFRQPTADETRLAQHINNLRTASRKLAHTPQNASSPHRRTVNWRQRGYQQAAQLT